MGKSLTAAKSRLTLVWQQHQALQIADVFAFRGEADEAFHWIDRSYRQRDDGLYLIKVDPLLKNIEADPRYSR